MAQLEFLNSPRQGERLSLSVDRPFAIGSGHATELRLAEDGLEDVHCVIKALKDGGFGLKDLGSAAGTRVNGKAITAVRLRNGDVLAVGGVELRYHDTPRQAAARLAGTGSTAARPEASPAAAPPPRDEGNGMSGGGAMPGGSAPAPAVSTAARERETILEPGTALGGYRIEDKLGQGGMGVVYRATQLSLNRQVALKVLSRHLTRNRTFVERFVGEARAAARFNHPHIVQVYDVANEGEIYYFSMELVDQGSLEEKVRREGAMDPREATRLIRDAARGLVYAESLQVVHQDIKPDNLMLNRHGLLKIADLGLAADPDQLREHMQAGTQAMGTPHFIAPEAVLKQKIDHRSDLYSLGCTFYRLLTGKTPFTGDSVKDILRKQVKEDARPLRELRPEIPDTVAAVVAQLMQKDPAARYQSAEELIRALDQILEGKRRRTLTLVAGAVAVIAIGTAVYFAMRPSETKTVIIEKEDPNARKNAAALREMQAENKRLQIAAELGHTDRIRALEAIRTEFKDTKAAQQMGEEIRTIQATIAEEDKARRQHEAALGTCVAAIAASVEGPLTQNDFTGAERALAAVPDQQRFAEESRLKEAVQAARTRIVEAAYGHYNRLIDAIPGQLASAKVADAEAAAAAVLAALGSPDFAADTRSRLAALQPLVEQRQQEITARKAELAAEHLKAALARYRQCLFGKEGTIARLAQLQIDLALEEAQRCVQALPEGPYAAPVQRLARVLQRADAGRKRLFEPGRTLTQNAIHLPPATGTAEPIAATVVSMDAGGVVFRVPAGRGKTRDETWPWPKCLVPSVLVPLLGEERFAMGDAERLDHAALLAAAGLGLPLSQAQEFVAAATPDKDPATLPDLTELSAAALDKALELVAQVRSPEHAEGARELAAWIEPERRGLMLLCEGLGAYRKGRFSEASRWLDRLLAGARETLAFGAVSRPDAAMRGK